MSAPSQRTISREVSLTGVGLHSGAETSITFRGAEPGTGLCFRRMDLPGQPRVPANLDHVASTDLGTTLGDGDTKVMTVEHLLAAFGAMQVDNALIDVDGPEVPIRDGSSQDYVKALVEARPVEQAAQASVITVREPLSVSGTDGQSYVATRDTALRISATIDFEHRAIGRQFGSFVVDEEGFRHELAPARTFGFKSDADTLRARGLARGASLANTVVLDNEGVMNDGLRFEDEFLRHKVGDIVGDLMLLGARVRAHIVTERPSHRGNVAFAAALRAQHRRDSREPIMDAAQIMACLPHRYPMLLVDRVTEIEKGKRIVGLKNVTINEPFFQGHFPGHPIMPGVLIIEAMAQAGGLLLLSELEDAEKKVVYFMTMDNVKFRRPVVPGDTLVFEVEVVQLRRGVCKMRGRGLVDGKVAAEAEFMASIVDK